jgi:thymidylate synthase (FAD)
MGQVTLLQITPDAEAHMGTCAAICYGSQGDPVKRLVYAVSRGHRSLLSHAHATVLVEGVSRVCTHQLVRHAHLRYLQESQRYTDQSHAGLVIPDSFPEDRRPQALELAAAGAELYRALREAGVPRGDARYLLPLGSTSRIAISGTLQAWWDFLVLRTAPDAQWEIRGVAGQIRQLLSDQCPNLPWPGGSA